MGSDFTSITGGATIIWFYSYANDSMMDFNGDIQSFSDNFNVNVNSETVYGRIDAIKTYSGTSREISFSILMDSSTQTLDYFEDIKYLAGQMYPRYHTSGVSAILKSPPMFAIKIDPFVVGGTSKDYTDDDGKEQSTTGLLPGFITSFGITYSTTEGIEVGTNKSGEPYDVPRELTLNFSFSPLHDRTGGFYDKGTSNTPGWPF